jgi:hypothetical protein
MHAALLLASFASVAWAQPTPPGPAIEPRPPGWEVPAGERGASPRGPIPAPLPPRSSDESERPKIRLESLERDDENDRR